MSKLLINPQTEKQIKAFLKNPSQILIQGSRGSGKSTILLWLASQILDIEEDQLSSYPYLLNLKPNEKGIIPIDSSRLIDHFISRAVPLKKPGIKRVILIDDAECLTIEAQNALLKILEQPPEDTIFILSTSNPTKLLVTVLSRLNLIRIINPEKNQFIKYLEDQGIDKDKARQALAISGGTIGLAIAVATEDKNHPLAQAVATARKILIANTYERLSLINNLTKDPKLVINTLSVLQQMAKVALETAQGKQVKRWNKVLISSYQSDRYLETRTNLRLTLTYLMLHI